MHPTSQPRGSLGRCRGSNLGRIYTQDISSTTTPYVVIYLRIQRWNILCRLCVMWAGSRREYTSYKKLLVALASSLCVMTLSQKVLRELSASYRKPGSVYYLASPYRILLELKRAGNKSATLRDVKLFLANEKGAVSRFNAVRSKVKRPAVICSALDQFWEADFLIFPRRLKFRNSYYTCLLIVIDCLSLYLWVYPLKRRSKAEVAERFSSLFAHRHPIILTTDGEAAFKNHPLYKRYGITHVVSTFGPHKARIVESLGVRLLQRAISKRIAITGDTRFLPVLSKIVDSLNDRYVPTLGYRPSEINVANSVKVYERRYRDLLKKKTPKSLYHVGQKVSSAGHAENLKRPAVACGFWTSTIHAPPFPKRCRYFRS